MDGIKAKTGVDYLCLLGSEYDSERSYYCMEGYSTDNTEEMLDLGDAENVTTYADALFQALHQGVGTLMDKMYDAGELDMMVSAFKLGTHGGHQPEP